MKRITTKAAVVVITVIAAVAVVVLLEIPSLSIFQICITCIHIVQQSSRLLAEQF